MFIKSTTGELMNIILGIVGAIVANAILSVFSIPSVAGSGTSSPVSLAPAF